jgi:Cd2+/Zn2+-exporting ATPase
VPLQADDTEGGLLLRIPAMDCPTEESEIRRAVEHIGAIGGLRFDLSARTLRIDAPNEALPTSSTPSAKRALPQSSSSRARQRAQIATAFHVVSLFLRWRSSWRWVQKSWLT